MALPNALTATQLGDLVQSTLRDLGEPKWTEISSSLQNHTVMKHLVRKNRIALESGYGIQFNVKVALSNAATNVGLGATDNVNIVDTMIQGQADWRNTTMNYAIIGQELSMNRTPRRIVDLIKERRLSALQDLSELMENNFWGPPVQLSDSITPWGINTWVVKNATEGFNGGVPSGYTVIGNINPTTYPNWQNWTYQYTNVSKDDLIRHWRKAATFTHFLPPVDGIPSPNTGDDYSFYTNYGVIGPLEEALESQNDNLGKDLASMDGMVHFRRVPVEWVPKLESDTTNPVYGINWGWFKTYILKGWWLKQTSVPIVPGQHTISAHFLDSTYQWVCKNRRAQFILATGTTYPS